MDDRETKMSRWATSIAALLHRNFRIWWFGQAVSLIGTWMQNMAQGWLILELTNSPLLLGILTAVQNLPFLIMSLPAGVLADSLSKRTIIYATQLIMLILAFIQGIMIYFEIIQYWHVLILAAFLGAVTAFDMTARQSFFVELVGKKDLMNAIALNSISINVARMVGPAVGGILIGKFGLSVCFLINSASFLTVLISLFFIKLPIEQQRSSKNTHISTQVAEGISYIKKLPIIMNAMILSALLNLFAANYSVLIPVLARENFGMEAGGYGFLVSAAGLGSLFGALLLSFISSYGPRRFILLSGAIGYCLFQLIISGVKSASLAATILVLIGFSMVIFNASTTSTIQANVADNYRGRVMSIYFLVYQGMIPFGSAISGLIANNWGAPKAFAFGAICGLIGILAIIFIDFRKIRKESNCIG